jgi:AcrR family transcriptional regulator
MTTGHTAAGPGRLTRKGQATRERIVVAAAGLMYAKGVAKTRTEDIQQAAGVHTSQIYHYFADKQSLIHAVIAYQTDAVLGAQESLFAQLDSVEGLQAWRDFAVDVQRRNNCIGGCPIGSLASEVAEQDPEARTYLAEGFDRWQSSIFGGLRAMHERGELRRDADPDELALALLGAMQGGLLLTQLKRDTAPLEATMNAMINYIDSLTIHPAPERY